METLSNFIQDNNKLYNIVTNRLLPIIQEFGRENIKINIPNWLKVSSQKYTKKDIDYIEVLTSIQHNNKEKTFTFRIEPAEFCK